MGVLGFKKANQFKYIPLVDRRRMSEDLRSSRSVSPDEAFPHWAAPIAASVRNFKGGTLIVNSAPFRDALVEAERIVSTTLEHKSKFRFYLHRFQILDAN